MLGGSLKRSIGRGFAVTTAALALSLALWAAAALARPGDLDTSFSGDGKVTTGFTSGFDGANAVAIQADGKIVAVGSSDDGFALARYNTDGTLDTSFNGTGMVTTVDVADGKLSEAFDVAIQPDQKIVVAGSGLFYPNPFNPSSLDFAVARYNTNGSLDTANFGGGDGAVLTHFFDGDPGDFTYFPENEAYAVGVQGDGKIVAAGYGVPDGGEGNESLIAVARYSSSGVLDPGFNGDGRVTTLAVPSSFYGVGYDLALPGNKVLVVGVEASPSSGGLASTLAQYNSDGTPDTGFGPSANGIRIRNITGPDEMHSVTRQADGKIVVGGFIGDNFALFRFNADGTNDDSFDDNGYITTTFTSGVSYDQVWDDVAIESGGRIVTAGTTTNGAGYSFAVGRFNANGAVDRTFGARCSGAQRTNNFGGAPNYGAGAAGLAIDSSGRLVVAGYSELDFGLARYLSGSAALADCVAPNTTIVGPRKTRKRRPTYRLISTEAGSHFTCRINGRGTSKPFFPCTSPFKMPRLRLGPTRFEARAIDKAGNSDASPAFLKIKRIRRRR